MIAYWKAYWALWCVCLFGALCFSAGLATGVSMAIGMLNAA